MFCPKCGAELIANTVFCHMCGTRVPFSQRNPEEDYKMGCAYRDGDGVTKDLVKSKEYFEKAARAGHLQSIVELAMAYKEGYGCQIDYAEALRLYMSAAERGNAESENQIGLFYSNGYGVQQNNAEALKWFERAANHGDAYGMRNSGVFYRDGLGTTQDLDKALYWLKKAGEAGHTGAYNDLGLMYYHGNGIMQDYGMAFSYFEKGYAIGDNNAKYNVAHSLMNGFGVQQDIPRALGIFEELVSVGYEGADEEAAECKKLLAEQEKRQAEEYYKMGCASYFGDGVVKDYVKAKEYFEKAAAIGHLQSIVELATLYKQGDGCQKDYQEAFRLYKLAADKGHAYSENKVGLFYDQGWGVQKNESEALKWFERAANHGNAAGMYNCGVFSEGGTGTEKDFAKAIYWYQKAAEHGYAEANNALGLMYYWGKGVPQDYDVAFSYFEKGAAAGDNNAKYDVADSLMRGRGVQQDIPRALGIFEELVKAGYEDADEEVAECKKLLAEQEKASANPDPVNPNASACSKGTGSEEKAPRQMPENLDKYFDGLIGMDSVKNQLDAIYKKILAAKKKQEIWEKMGRTTEKSVESYNFALLGNPGTGKTVVARVIAEFLYDVGVRNENKLVETDRSGLVGEYIGETPKKTAAKIDDAMGGTLFVDEAYSLFVEDSPKDYGREAIDTLLKQMEDKRGDFSVIMAGYKEPMMNMMKKANIGFASRFTYIIEIPDYSDDELVEIAHSLLEKKGYKYNDDLDDAIRKCIKHDRIEPKSFGNARYIRQLIDKGIEAQSVRVLSLPADVEDVEYITLKAIDLWQEKSDADSVEKCLEELNALTGLSSVKKQVQELIDSIRTIQELEKRGIKSAGGVGNLHMVFLGNPGTGKTTVARIIGRLYSALGLLKRNDVFVETSRADLVGQHVGETAQKVIDKVSEAKGGILFIDEAYSLVKDSRDSFGKEAVDTLIKEMEDNRESLVVILAGYSDTMEAFFAIANPGLKSRVPTELNFEDYSIEELMMIAKGMIKKNYHTITEDAYEALKDIISSEMNQENFGNARNVRNIVEKIERNQMARVSKLLNELTNEELTTIIREDVESLPQAKQSGKGNQYH